MALGCLGEAGNLIKINPRCDFVRGHALFRPIVRARIEFVKMGIRGLSRGVMGQVKRVDPLIFPARIEAIRFGICNLAEIEYPAEFFKSAIRL